MGRRAGGAGGHLAELVAAAAGRSGPLGYDEVVDLALYHPDLGFYETGGGAGRGGDFLTSPEVGPLFGAVMARALDAWWTDLGRPDPYTVVECGAGRGALATAVVGADPECRPALRYLAVERSAALRARHPATVESVDTLPPGPLVGVVLANELLDNLAFGLLERTDRGWAEVRVAADLTEVLAEPSPAPVGRLAPEAVVGARVPVQAAAADWLRTALAVLERGRVVVLDYGDTTPSMARRPWRDWVRTYRGHGRGGHPLADLGRQDVTCEVAIDQLAEVAPPAADRSQAGFLSAHGLDDLVAEARTRWQERAHVGDLAALRWRSRVHEGAALADPGGLGAFRVLEWTKGGEALDRLGVDG